MFHVKRKRLLAPISIRLDPEVKAALVAMAVVEERRPSWVARKALRQWLVENKAAISTAKRRRRKSLQAER